MCYNKTCAINHTLERAMSRSIDNRFDQGGTNVEVHAADSSPYNRRQWPSLHIGSRRDKHPGSATRVNRNNHTLNDQAQTGMRPTMNYYSKWPQQNAPKGMRQYRTGLHEFSDQHKLRHMSVDDSGDTVFHSNDPEIAAPSFGHSLLKRSGYKGDIVEQVAPGHTNNLGQPDVDVTDPAIPTDMIGRKQLSNQFNRSKLNIEDLRTMYTLDESIPNFLTLDRTAKQNFMADITDIRKQV